MLIMWVKQGELYKEFDRADSISFSKFCSDLSIKSFYLDTQSIIIIRQFYIQRKQAWAIIRFLSVQSYWQRYRR